MNWSEYSRFVGNIFGVPLALEVLMAFFLESTFIGLWWFGKDRLPAWVRLASIWLVAIGTQISAFWIILANAWMHHPVGYRIENGQALLTSFSAVVFNYKAWLFTFHVNGSPDVHPLLLPGGLRLRRRHPAAAARPHRGRGARADR